MTDHAKAHIEAFCSPEDWKGFTKYLTDTNRFVLSPYWHDFIAHVVATARERVQVLECGHSLTRARLGTREVSFDDGDEQPAPLAPDDMGCPPQHLSIPGRINPIGIPCLYLSTNVETAISEVRPWVGAEISIGHFEAQTDLRIVDTSRDSPQNPMALFELTTTDFRKRDVDQFTPIQKERYVWGDINQAFSKPVAPNDSHLRYLPTQYLAERLKAEGYDGIAYRSALSSDGHNVALFDTRKVKCVQCRMFAVERVKYDASESGNPLFVSDDGTVRFLRVTDVRPAQVKGAGPPSEGQG